MWNDTIKCCHRNNIVGKYKKIKLGKIISSFFDLTIILCLFLEKLFIDLRQLFIDLVQTLFCTFIFQKNEFYSSSQLVELFSWVHTKIYFYRMKYPAWLVKMLELMPRTQIRLVLVVSEGVHWSCQSIIWYVLKCEELLFS